MNYTAELVDLSNAWSGLQNSKGYVPYTACPRKLWRLEAEVEVIINRLEVQMRTIPKEVPNPVLGGEPLVNPLFAGLEAELHRLMLLSELLKETGEIAAISQIPKYRHGGKRAQSTKHYLFCQGNGPFSIAQPPELYGGIYLSVLHGVLTESGFRLAGDREGLRGKRTMQIGPAIERTALANKIVDLSDESFVSKYQFYVGEYLVSELRKNLFGQAFGGAKDLVKLGGYSNPALKAAFVSVDFAKAIAGMPAAQSKAQKILDDGRIIVDNARLGNYAQLLRIQGVVVEEYGIAPTLAELAFGREPPKVWRISLRITVDTFPAVNAMNEIIEEYAERYPTLNLQTFTPEQFTQDPSVALELFKDSSFCICPESEQSRRRRCTCGSSNRKARFTTEVQELSDRMISGHHLSLYHQNQNALSEMTPD